MDYKDTHFVFNDWKVPIDHEGIVLNQIAVYLGKSLSNAIHPHEEIFKSREANELLRALPFDD